MPLLTLIYLTSSLDKSNLGNAKSLGLMKDIGNDPTGSTYALLNSLYFVSYAPFSKCFRPSLSHAGLRENSGALRSAREANTDDLGAHVLCSALGRLCNSLCRSSELCWSFRLSILHRTG